MLQKYYNERHFQTNQSSFDQTYWPLGETGRNNITDVQDTLTVYIYICMCVCVCVYIYIYIYKGKNLAICSLLILKHPMVLAKRKCHFKMVN
jgi:hypothetical protein